ncbi:nickel cation transmembrane transporter [Malassezia pachydermatis]|uniref:Nickel/cobalt efflux system n=1 Tax=Malassezia pachydermatis TaxID=77020 RepID=A0A0M8MN42_9BASI|nr:hypothetical protein Malapachy_0830 [Malassezia pachydermatis]KOS14908.1 hypothetical protein Malapachy_0830 [Malassezia pachydermatis]
MRWLQKRGCASGAERRPRRLTFLARGFLLLAALFLVNVILWVATTITFTIKHDNGVAPPSNASHEASGILSGEDDGPGQTSSLMSIALIAWTTGLRHAVDADHISAIDNATRRIMAVPRRDGRGFRRPVTVGLFFSLGHSCVVIAVVIAVAVSFITYTRMDTVSEVGGIIGASVSGSFLFLIGVINSIILVHSFLQMRRVRRQERLDEARVEAAIAQAEAQAQSNAEVDAPAGIPHLAPPPQAHVKEDVPATTESATPTMHHGIHLVDPFETRPAMDEKEVHKVMDELNDPSLPDKVDEAHSPTGEKRPTAEFRGLFTRLAMPLLKVIDRPWKMLPIGILFGLGFDTASTISLLGIALIAGGGLNGGNSNGSIVLLALLFTAGMSFIDSCDSVLMICAYSWEELDAMPKWYSPWEPVPDKIDTHQEVTTSRESDIAHELVLSTTPFALLLTLLSVLMAFIVAVIEILGLIGEHCSQCSAAADRQAATHDGGLAGSWWLWWRWCNDYFGYIGIGITGIFVVCVVVALLFTIRHARQRHAHRAALRDRAGKWGVQY